MLALQGESHTEPTYTDCNQEHLLEASNDNQHPHHILLIEDLVADAKLVEHALVKSNIQHELTVLRNGDDVLPYLKQARQFCSFPDIIFLDLGLPGTTGFDVLNELSSSHPSIRDTSIVILTNMENFEYVQSHYNKNLSIISYIQKPCETAAIQAIMNKV